MPLGWVLEDDAGRPLLLTFTVYLWCASVVSVVSHTTVFNIYMTLLSEVVMRFGLWCYQYADSNYLLALGNGVRQVLDGIAFSECPRFAVEGPVDCITALGCLGGDGSQKCVLLP